GGFPTSNPGGAPGPDVLVVSVVEPGCATAANEISTGVPLIVVSTGRTTTLLPVDVLTTVSVATAVSEPETAVIDPVPTFVAMARPLAIIVAAALPLVQPTVITSATPAIVNGASTNGPLF